MDAAGWSDLIKQAPYPAAVIVVVYMFLRYLQVMMCEWRAYFDRLSQVQSESLTKLSLEIRELREAYMKTGTMRRTKTEG